MSKLTSYTEETVRPPGRSESQPLFNKQQEPGNPSSHSVMTFSGSMFGRSLLEEIDKTIDAMEVHPIHSNHFTLQLLTPFHKPPECASMWCKTLYA